ncbi:unnamed protein product [Prunus brigantina]
MATYGTHRMQRTQTRMGKSFTGEGCVMRDRVACIDTLIHGILNEEYEGDNPFHCCTPLCESSEEGHGDSHCVFEDDCQICFGVEKNSEKKYFERVNKLNLV